MSKPIDNANLPKGIEEGHADMRVKADKQEEDNLFEEIRPWHSSKHSASQSV